MMNTIWVSWGDVFNASLQNLWWGFVQFAPKLVIAIVFFVVGWVLGSLIARAIEQIFSALKIDNLFRSLGAENFLRRAGVNLNTGYFVGEIVKWFVIIVFLLPSLSLVLGPDNAVESFLKVDVFGYLPNVFIAILVLIIGAVVSEALAKTVLASAKSMNLRSAHMLSVVAKYAVYIFTFIIALGKLGLGEFMTALFQGIVYTVGIAIALAFGLGGKEHASRLLSKISEESSQR